MPISLFRNFTPAAMEASMKFLPAVMESWIHWPGLPPKMLSTLLAATAATPVRPSAPPMAQTAKTSHRGSERPAWGRHRIYPLPPSKNARPPWFSPDGRAFCGLLSVRCKSAQRTVVWGTSRKSITGSSLFAKSSVKISLPFFASNGSSCRVLSPAAIILRSACSVMVGTSPQHTLHFCPQKGSWMHICKLHTPDFVRSDSKLLLFSWRSF